MKLRFEKLRFRNILSVGDNPVELEFKTGLNLIQGTNGNGKSTILDALSFAMFGKPYRDIKLEELINNINKNNLETEVTFVIGKDSYSIIRALRPDNLKILKNGKDLDILSSKKLTQEKINELIGIDYVAFKQLICLSVNSSSSFFDMSSHEKRGFIENIFNIRQLSEICKKVKLKDTATKADIALNEKQIFNINALIHNTQNSLTQMKHHEEIYESKKKQDLKLIKDKIKVFDEEYNTELAQYEECEKDYDEEKLKALIQERAKVWDTYTTVQARIKVEQISMDKAKEGLGKIDDLTICPVCLKTIEHTDLDYFYGIIQSVSKQIDAFKVTENEYNRKLDKIDKSIELFGTIKNKMQTLYSSFSSKKSIIENLMESYNSRKNEVIDFNSSIIEESLNKLLSQLATEEAKKKQFIEDHNVNGQIIEILSDEGFKTFFYATIIPVLNQVLKEIIKQFTIKDLIEITFDEYLDINLSNGRYQRSFNSFSDGEKKRIDVVIKIALFRVCRLVSNWSSDLCLFDEVIDAGLDSEGVESVINALNAELDTESKTYIISHKIHEEHMTNFTNILTVKRQGEFSIYD